MASLSIKALFPDKLRLGIAIAGVVFSVVLAAMQAGLFLGFESSTANVIEHSGADLWITAKGVPFLEVAPAFPESKLNRVRAVDGVARARKFIVQISNWKRPDGLPQNCEIIGFDPNLGAAGPWNIDEGNADDLRFPFTVMVDRFYAERLGVSRIGDMVEIENFRARVVGFTSGIRTFTTAPPVFTSLRNAAFYTRVPDSKAQFILVNASPGVNLENLRDQLRDELGGVDVWTRQDLSSLTTHYWLLGTGAGIALTVVGLLALLLGVVVVAQTVYTATVDHLREFGTWKVLGASNWHVYKAILRQAILIGIIGYIVGVAIALWMANMGSASGAYILLTPYLLAGLLLRTIGMCLIASMVSIGKVNSIDPAAVFEA